MNDEDRHVAVTLRFQEPQRFAKGGLAKAAEDVKGAGRYGDDMVIHINKTEFSQLRKEWGEPTINPKTGLPEFFLSGLQSWFKQNPWASAAIGVAGSALGAGQFIGDGLSNLTGIGTAGSTAADAVGSGLLGGGLGALTGGGKGALIGGLTGAATPYVSNLISGGTGGAHGILDGLFSGSGSGFGSATGTGSALSGSNGDGGFHGAGTSSAGIDAGTTGGGSSGGGGSGNSSNSSGGLGSIFGGGKSSIPALVALAGIASALGQKKGPSAAAQAAAQRESASQVAFNQHLQPSTFGRTYLGAPQDPLHYGERSGNQPMFANNQLSNRQAFAKGGEVHLPPSGPGLPFGYHPAPTAIKAMPQATDIPHLAVGGRPGDATPLPSNYVRGPGDGRSDDIPARLSHGEYVMDAGTVSMLGNGSSDAGARRLDEMRHAVRKHMGPSLAQGKMPPDAKPPHAYMKGGLSR